MDQGVKRRCLACGATLSAAYIGSRCGACGQGPMVDLEGDYVNRMSGPGSVAGGRCPFCDGTGYRETLSGVFLCAWCQPPLAPAEAQAAARVRQGRIEKLLA